MTVLIDRNTIKAHSSMMNRMLSRLLIIMLIALPSWYFSDMDSPSRLYAYVLPIITFICLVSFCIWVISVFAKIRESKTS